MNLKNHTQDRHARMSRTILVKCTFVIPVEVPDESDDYHVVFDIEDNHCPGPGRVWEALSDHIKECDDKGVCWACNLGGENLIVGEVPECGGEGAEGHRRSHR